MRGARPSPAGALGGRDGARQALEVLEARLAEVEASLDDADPGSSPPSRHSSDPSSVMLTPGPRIELPADTPLDTVLLVYERRSLVNRIESARSEHAENATESIVPGSYATVVERSEPDQITPELPSPLIPIAVAVGIGILLAIAVPVLMDRIDHSIRDPHAPLAPRWPHPCSRPSRPRRRPTSPRWPIPAPSETAPTAGWPRPASPPTSCPGPSP